MDEIVLILINFQLRNYLEEKINSGCCKKHFKTNSKSELNKKKRKIES